MAKESGKFNLKHYFMENAFCHPKGLLGQMGGMLMARDRVLPAWLLELLQVKSFDTVLEIASGPGVGLELASSLVQKGLVVGIDPSDTMLGMARKHNHKRIEDGHVELYKTTVDNLPFDDNYFDIAFTTNSFHLWTDPLAGLREVRRTLRADGRIGVAISSYSNSPTDKYIEYFKEAGFQDARGVEIKEKGKCFIGKK